MKLMEPERHCTRWGSQNPGMTQEFGTSPVSAQAARWFAAQLRRLASLEERESYRRWAENAANRRALARLHALWADLEHVYTGAEQHRRIAHPSRKVAIVTGCVAAATLCLLCFVGGPFWTTLDWTTR